MTTRRLTNLRWQSLGFLIPLWIALVAFVAPTLHLHLGAAAPSGPFLLVRSSTIYAAPVAAAHHVQQSSPQAGTIGPALTRSQNDTGADDCLICQWLTSVSYNATMAALPLLVLLTACALLLLKVRFAALCVRPTPRRGLRAPPVLIATLA